MTLAASIPVVWVTDYERARGFWRDVLGFRVVGEVGEPVTVFEVLDDELLRDPAIEMGEDT